MSDARSILARHVIAVRSGDLPGTRRPRERDRWVRLELALVLAATRRKELPLKDVAPAGGWKDVTTLLTCYPHADEATLLKVMASPIRLVSRRMTSSLEKQ